jgi:Ca-activated chloride channel homolog
MHLMVESVWPLILLAIVPYFWWILRHSDAELGRKHLQLLTVLRSFNAILVVLALMQPTLYRSSARVSVVYLLDISQSIAGDSIRRALDWIRTTQSSGHPDHSQFIAFGSNAIPFGNVDDLKRVHVSSDNRPGSIDQSATDISLALDQAIRSFAPDHLNRIVLLSDGNDNAGDLSEAISRLNRDNVHVYTVPMETRADRDVWVEAVQTAPAVTAGEQFPVEVHVYSQLDTSADVELSNDNTLLTSRSVHLNKGLNRVSFETRVAEESSTVVLTATTKTARDSFNANNVFHEPVVVKGRPRILYVESYAPAAQYLKKALTMEGLLVDVAAPEQLPSTVDGLDRYDAIILSDINAKAMTARQMNSVETYVRELGGGLILAGGENSYGKDGYSDTAIEKALPITFDSQKRPPTVAMVVVIDVSGSMNAGQLALAKEAAKAPLNVLRPSDRFGVLSFNTGFSWVAPLQPALNRNTITTQIERLYAGGGTNIYVGLTAAYTELMQAPEEVKTVVLLSDGLTQTADYKSLVSGMIDAGINVSSVSVGVRSNRELMADIAMWGKGRAYFIDSYDRVPQVFLKETELALGKTLQEQPFLAIVKKNVEAFKGIDFGAAPRLLGYVVTKAKPTSEVLLTESWTGGPLLARWQYGSGKTAAFTSDVKSRWAAEWIGWSGYPKFWAQVVRETMRRRNDDDFKMDVTRQGDFAVVSLDVIDKTGRFRDNLSPKLRVTGPNEKPATTEVPQVGPGQYETRVRLEKKRTYAFNVSAAGNVASRTLEYSYPAEYHFYPPDISKLQAISAETGGVFQPAGPEIFDPHGETTQAPVPLWPWLVSIVLALYLVDILLRRIRLFPGRTTLASSRS